MSSKMLIKVSFEIGHSASMKSKISPEGFTHDWELFVRGCDGCNLSRFVEKVVFNLHDSFPKPKRTIKEPPYVLKESGYAGFLLPIDIYMKGTARDETKKITYQYDLDLQKMCSAVKYTYNFPNPSSDFRRKLLEGGGINTTAMLNDDKSRDAHDDRSQLISKPKLSGNNDGSGTSSGNSNKKHKTKTTPDELKPTNTFANLFGTPITKISNSKHSPEQKVNNSSNSKIPNTHNNSSNTSTTKQLAQKTSEKSSSKEKSEKLSKEKKEKNKSSSALTTSVKESSSNKTTSGDKHGRREEKRKEKGQTKYRDRSKEKSLKRPLSPKRNSRSPKRSTSPVSRNSLGNKHVLEPVVSILKHDEKISGGNSGSSSSTKKSKKEKREKSKERDRSDGKKDRDSKQLIHQSKQKDEKSLSKSLEKINGTSKKERDNASDNSTLKDTTRDKTGSKYRPFDSKVDLPIETVQQNKNPPLVDAKKPEKYEKDGYDRKHKHKKKDKNKEKDKDRKKEKEKLSKAAVKEISEESSLTTSSNHKRSHVQTPPNPLANMTNSKINPVPTIFRKFSDKSSSEFEVDDDYLTSTASTLPSVKYEKPGIVDLIISEHTNVTQSEMAAPRTIQMQTESPKKFIDKVTKKSKESKTNQSLTPIKDDKKRKRKNKAEKQKHELESSNSKRKTRSPLHDEEPTHKLSNKEDQPSKAIKEENIDGKLIASQTPPISHISDLLLSQKQNQPPQLLQSDVITSNSSITMPNMPSESTSSFHPTREPIAIDYISQLRILQHKIMAMQDNSNLQKVVEIIADTGRYEITSRTFDFDLCTLDRTTVQRLQDFFSTKWDTKNRGSS